MFTIRSIFVILFFATTLSFSASAQSKDEATVVDVVKQIVAAQQEYRPDLLDKLFAPDYIEISPVGEFDERSKVLGFYKPEDKPPADKMSVSTTVNDANVRIYGKFAVVIARLEFTVAPAGRPASKRSMRATYVLRKTGKSWLVSSAQFTGMKS